MQERELFEFLEEQHDFYNSVAFIEADPVSIPHLFSKKEDIEIAGFLSATIAWGQRASILKNAKKLMAWMDFSPHEFILQHSAKELKPFKNFVHRTFNGTDCLYFISALKNIYQQHQGMEAVFTKYTDPEGAHIGPAIVGFRTIFFELDFPSRTKKHLSDPSTDSAVKRINMFLRWMVRKDRRGVDFGLWKNILPRQLLCPLDVHSGRVARQLGLLSRTQNDWKAVLELTAALKRFDPEDPVKYDFSLFGLGVNAKKL
jgi:uncharacterized protein (TIGR02757 family)